MSSELWEESSMALTRPPKGHYTEIEVAQILGLPIEELRALVRKHILTDEEGLTNLPITSFLPADLLLLRLFIGHGGTAPLAEPAPSDAAPGGGTTEV
jgi:hypothetical protein